MHLNCDNGLVTRFSAKAFCAHVASLFDLEISYSDIAGVNNLSLEVLDCKYLKWRHISVFL